MALKRKITKAEFDKLNDSFKAEYIEDGEDYRLDIDGDEDTSSLKRAKDREKELRQQAENKLREAQAELDKLSGDDARKRGDIATLEKSWQKKLDDQKADYEGRVGKLTAHTTKTLVDSVAMQVATELAGKNAKIMLPHIKSRLQADFDGDEPKTRILDADGKPSALTVADLKAEFVANADYAGIVIGSKASGGAGGQQQKKPAGGAGGDDSKLDLSRLSPAQMAERIRETKNSQKEDA